MNMCVNLSDLIHSMTECNWRVTYRKVMEENKYGNVGRNILKGDTEESMATFVV